MKKKILSLLFILSITCTLFLLVIQSAGYEAVLRKARALEKTQAEWVEENRRLLANIALAGSRARVHASMALADGYSLASPEKTLRIRVKPGGSSLDG